MSIVDASTYTNQYQLVLISPPTATTPSSLQTMQQNVGLNYNLILQCSAGTIGIRTTTPTSGAAFDVGGTSTSTFYTFLNGLGLSGRDISIYHNVPNNDMAFHTNRSSTTTANILLCTRATERLRIDGPTGNIKFTNSFGINFSSFLSRFTIRMSYNDGNTGGFCIDSSDPNIYILRIFSYVQAGSQVGYHFQVNKIASPVNAITLNYDGSVKIGTNATVTNNLNFGTLQIGGSDSYY
jgi:hypothetical protein